MTEASSCVWQGNQHFYTWLRATFDAAAWRNNDCEWERGVSKDDVRCEDIRWRWTGAGGGARVSVLAGRKPGTAAQHTAYGVRGTVHSTSEHA